MALDRAVLSATAIEQDAGQQRYDAISRDLSDSRQDTQDQLARTHQLNQLIADLRLQVEQLSKAKQALIDQVAHSSHEVDQLKANQLQLTESHTLTLQLKWRD